MKLSKLSSDTTHRPTIALFDILFLPSSSNYLSFVWQAKGCFLSNCWETGLCRQLSRSLLVGSLPLTFTVFRQDPGGVKLHASVSTAALDWEHVAILHVWWTHSFLSSHVYLQSCQQTAFF